MATNLIQWNSNINLDNDSIFLIFSQVWCPPCKALAPVLDQVDKMITNNSLKMCKIDCEDHPDLAHRFNIRSVPTMILVHRGKVTNYNGPRDNHSIYNWLMDHTK